MRYVSFIHQDEAGYGVINLLATLQVALLE